MTKLTICVNPNVRLIRGSNVGMWEKLSIMSASRIYGLMDFTDSNFVISKPELVEGEKSKYLTSSFVIFRCLGVARQDKE